MAKNKIPYNLREFMPNGKGKTLPRKKVFKDLFGKEIEVALETPGFTFKRFGLYALLGLFVGVIPVAIGLLWFPAILLTEKSGNGFSDCLR